ncbi:MAG: GDP-mannose 4,6-dehydratase [candidate division KSB1 bacterium]|nr:GDP-mannose 4,6-dehydratase [candidate division KSB1 bacterium]
MKALVTGSTGFIGSFLVEELLTKNYEVFCLVRKTSNLHWLQGLKVKFVYGSLEDQGSLQKAVTGMNYIFHLAGLTKAKRKEDYFQVNFQGTVNLLSALKNTPSEIRRFILVSSQAAAGPSLTGKPVTEDEPPRPITPYGQSKLKAEEVTLQYGQTMPVTIVRPSIVYGPRDTDVLEVFKYVRRGLKPVLLGDSRYVSLVYVQDLVQGIVLAAENERSTGKIYFLANSESYSWEELEDEIARALNKTVWRIKLPPFFLDCLALASEATAKLLGTAALVNRYKVLEMKQRFWLCDTSRARQELGFQPRISLPEGIKKTVAWYVKEGWL